MSVSVHNLTKTYGSQIAVNGISFDVKKGEILGFLGPNGAGKSTTMKMLTGFIPPTSGSADICGEDIIRNSIEVRKHIGYLPESNPLYYDMYVREFLNFCARITGFRSNVRGRINYLIETVGLKEEQHKKIGQLSKGYKQRVGLAQALLHDPEVLILDEPTSGLDPNQLADIRALIRNLGKDKTILLSTHIMQEVQSVCDRIIIIHKGNLVADDTPQHLQNSLQGAFFISVEFEKPMEASELLKIDPTIRVSPSFGTHFQIQCSDSKALRKKLFVFSGNSDNPLLTLKEESQSLESVFQELTKNN